MLIEFRVRNFRSIRDEQVLSLVASSDKSLKETNTLVSGIKVAPSLLRSAVIYGPNAGGKSNLVKAIQYMRGVVVESASLMQPSQTFNAQTFRLDSVSESGNTEFEATFILEGVRYQYGFELNTQRITKEYLLVYKAFKPQQWFERHYDLIANKDIYEFSSGLKGSKSLWENATRSNSLFLSMAVQLNSSQLRPIFDWFNNMLTIFNEISPLNPQFSVDMLKQSDGKQLICDFLTAADISIADINIVTRKVPGQSLHFDLTANKTEVRSEEQEINEVQFHHETDKGKAVFGLNDESLGTQRLLFLAGPILDILNKGRTLIVDELDSSLHPLLVRRLVELFHSTLNTKGAQLIFTTHDTSLLDPELFRRDQVWFVEKDREQASSLYPLSDFSPRKNEALETGYLSGRYGALPFFKNGKM
ncbi:MAG: ATP-binding protein [Methylotenera sp.]|nr:ATP-binding protein [Methylotenera sp.]MDO9387911.1 ATP-binding protein [Methylotenera sp.]MDP3087121.1 ATP-binding protein [Methylotenera sp.]MDP3094204.1 ATP-binding protein [Methylotenera sp.]MDZ4222509.1 ATP-binding protein [Methylotenera sp.]